MTYAQTIEEMKAALQRAFNMNVDNMSDEMIQHYYNILYYGD